MGEPFQPCTNTSDLVELSLQQQLYLKPEGKINITVALPAVSLPGKTISNWEVMERLRQAAQPDEFQVIKVSKSTLEFIRFDGEIENRAQVRSVISRIDGKVIRLSGFPEPLKVRAAEAKADFPTRHDWDKYFRDAKNMNEMKPGERPDTIFLQGLPSKWFVSKRDRRNGSTTPSEFALHKVFECFGEIRHVDIPMLDPYRNSMKTSISGIRTFSHTTDAAFDGFVQYRDYISFVKAMDSLRGMKLVHRDGVKAFSSCIKVDFDKTKHLSDMSIRRRQVEREKLMAKEREKEEEKRREEDALKKAMQQDLNKKQEEKRLKGERRKEREEKRKQRILKKLKKKEAEQMNIKIAIEERKLLMAQRKLESIRLLDELFERVKIETQKEITKQKEKELDNQLSKVKQKHEEKLRKKEEKESKKKDKLVDKEKQLRKKLVKKIKMAQEQQMEERRERLRKTIEGKQKMKSVLKLKDGNEIVAEQKEYDPVDYRVPYDHYGDHYGGYGYQNWVPRGGYRGRFFPWRPFRGHRGSYHYHYQDCEPRMDSEWPAEQTHHTKSAADEIEEVSSNAESSATSKYSHLGSSSEGEEKKKGKTPEVRETWPGYEGMPQDESASHPWGGYSDYYNPRYIRRGGRRPRGPFRGGARGSFGPQINPNVPTSSFYMQSINEHYYRYFNKITKGEQEEKPRRSRSESSERVVCRKVLSRSRSRGKSYSRSSSRSRSRSRTRRSRSRSRSRESKSRSRARSQSKDRKSRSKSKSKRSRSKSQERKSRSKSMERKSRSKSKERRSRSKSKERRSPSKPKERSRTQSKERKSRSKSKERSRAQSKERKSRSKSKERSRTQSKERKSRSKSKERCRTQSKERKSQSKSKEQRSPSKPMERARSKSKEGKSRSKSKEPTSQSESKERKSLSKSKERRRLSIAKERRSRSKSENRNELNDENRRSRSKSNPLNRSPQKNRENKRDILASREKKSKKPSPRKETPPDRFDELSLSLSESGGWSSPERKAKPLGNPNWEPSESQRFRRSRDYMPHYSRFRPHYEPSASRAPQIRSLVSRPAQHPRSPSRDGRLRKDNEESKPRSSINRRRTPSKHSADKRAPSPFLEFDHGGENSKATSSKKRKNSSTEDLKHHEKKNKHHHDKKTKKKSSRRDDSK